MTIIYHGWTPTIPEHERIDNEIAACRSFLEIDPNNQYWRNRLAELEQKRIMNNITPEAQEAYFELCNYPTATQTAAAYGQLDLTEKVTSAFRVFGKDAVRVLNDDAEWRDEQDTRESVRP